MPSHRLPRVAQAVREVVANAVLFDLADPRVKGVTVLGAEVSPDLRKATVRVSVTGSPTQQKLAMRGLKHAAGHVQAKVAARLQTRFTPVLNFELDEGVKKSIAITQLIDDAIQADRRPDDAPPSTDDGPPGDDLGLDGSEPFVADESDDDDDS